MSTLQNTIRKVSTGELIIQGSTAFTNIRRSIFSSGICTSDFIIHSRDKLLPHILRGYYYRCTIVHLYDIPENHPRAPAVRPCEILGVLRISSILNPEVQLVLAVSVVLKLVQLKNTVVGCVRCQYQQDLTSK